MENRPNHDLAEQFAAAEAWWRDAGVDLDFSDDATAWLADPEDESAPAAKPAPFQRPAPPPPPPKPKMGGDKDGWPTDLAMFRQWWLEEPSLGSSGITRRVAPRGDAGAALLVLVPMPEKDDGDILLSGMEGRLITGFAGAAGIDPAALHIMSACPRHMASPDWADMAEGGLGDVLLHYIALAAPQRLLVLGRDILPLIGHDPAQDAPGPGELRIQERTLPVLASYAPARLLAHARLRAGLWRQWLDWTDLTE